MTTEYVPPTVASFVESIRAANPRLTDRNSQTITGLATLYRLLDFHQHTLDDNPGSAFAASEYVKLRTLALRHEVSLGIAKSVLDDTEPPAPRQSARRQRGAPPVDEFFTGEPR